MKKVFLFQFIAVCYLSFMAAALAQDFDSLNTKSLNKNQEEPSQNQEQYLLKYKVPSRIEQSIKNNGGINATETKFLLPLYQCPYNKNLVYLDLRGEINNSPLHQVNAAIGYRKLLENTKFLNQSQWIVGFYGGIGRSYTRYKSSFQQESFGIEALSEDYDFRANYYLVQEKERRVGDDYVTHDGDETYDITNTYSIHETALTGADLELGHKLPIKTISTKLYIGTYFYQQPKSHQTSNAIYSSFFKQGYNSINGQKLRLELTLDHTNLKHLNKNLSLSLNTEYTHDRLNKGQIFTIIKISYQFNNNYQLPTTNNLYYRMNEFTVRNYVVTDASDQMGTVRSDKGGGGDGDVDDSGGDI